MLGSTCPGLKVGRAGTEGGVLLFSCAVVPGAAVALLVEAPAGFPLEELGELGVGDGFAAPLSATVATPGAEPLLLAVALFLAELSLVAVPLGASTGLYPLEDAETSLEGFSDEQPNGVAHAARTDKANQRREAIFEELATERKGRLTGFS